MKSAFSLWGMGSQRRAIWAGAWCLMLLAAVLGTAVANTEGDALHALRQALSDPYEVLESWDPSYVNPCSWFHVTCSSPENHVVRVDLGNAGLSGTLVPDLGVLSELQYLEMYSNNITGPIPASLGNLTQLVSLDLYENNFVGVIPEELGNLSELKYLRLSRNRLTGLIPESLTGLDELQVLDLSYNNLIGDIPVTGVFAYFNYTSFEGNPDLHYPDSLSAPAPAPSSGERW